MKAKRLLILLICIVLVLPTLSLAQEAQMAVVNNPNPQDRLHLRTKPNKNSQSLGKYYNGAIVYISSYVSDEWAKVYIGDISAPDGGATGVLEGYMLREFLSFDIDKVISAQPIVKIIGKHRLNLRHAPTKKSPSIMLYDPGISVKVIGISPGWCHVLIGGNVGFVMTEYLSPRPEYDLSPSNYLGYAVVNNPSQKDRLNLRTAPRTSSTSLGKYYNGVTVTIIEKRKDGWSKVRIGTLEGYMQNNYLAMNAKEGTVVAAMPTVSAKDKAILYARPSFKAGALNQYTKNMQVVVLGLTPQWYHVQVEGYTGFIPADDLTPSLY